MDRSYFCFSSFSCCLQWNKLTGLFFFEINVVKKLLSKKKLLPLHFFTRCCNCSLCYLVRWAFCIVHSSLCCCCSLCWCIGMMWVRMIWDVILPMAAMAIDRLHTQTFVGQSLDSTTLAVKVLKKRPFTIFCFRMSNYHNSVRLIWKLPLFDRQMRSIPFRCNAIRANSQNDSLILKSHNGDISKHAILLRDA